MNLFERTPEDLVFIKQRLLELNIPFRETMFDDLAYSNHKNFVELSAGYMHLENAEEDKENPDLELIKRFNQLKESILDREHNSHKYKYWENMLYLLEQKKIFNTFPKWY